jgi:hypothetical protein
LYRVIYGIALLNGHTGFYVLNIIVFLHHFTKACVTNPTAAGRFLVAGDFTGLPLIFHIVWVQFKISLEEMHHICHRWGADRPSLWRSPAWELQVLRR